MVRPVTDTFYASPQITAEAMAQLAEHGFTDVICNRPDEENGPAEQSSEMQKAAEAAGLKFHFHPLVHAKLLEKDVIARQKALIAGATGNVLAYCASGNRSTVVWGLGQAGEMPASEIMEKAAAAGYDLSQLAPMLG